MARSITISNSKFFGVRNAQSAVLEPEDARGDVGRLMLAVRHPCQLATSPSFPKDLLGETAAAVAAVVAATEGWIPVGEPYPKGGAFKARYSKPNLTSDAALCAASCKGYRRSLNCAFARIKASILVCDRCAGTSSWQPTLVARLANGSLMSNLTRCL